MSESNRRSAGSACAGRGPVALRARVLARPLVVLRFVSMVVGALVAAAPVPVHAQMSPVGPLLSIAETEALVRSAAYEGLSQEQAARIGAQGGARLIELLADGEEKPNHGRILLALGIWGGPGAFEAIEDWKRGALAGAELDRPTFRAWQVLPFALGQLATRDPRALARLGECFDAPLPSFRFGRFSPAALRALERRAAASVLAESGSPAAAQLLESVASRTRDPELGAHVEAVRAEARAARGPAR